MPPVCIDAKKIYLFPFFLAVFFAAAFFFFAAIA
ncbi:MAG: hypothetical protein UU76_C0021G0007 [Parcubacteria group bacterium GW2011_GWC1_41_7]|nr:MAG: hypothetical protein UU76_C0021G0007 [Parcubacteria group bacterium GW2011_GWC1_41_7]